MAQYYLTGNEPFSSRWRQIKTNHFRIIFHEEAEKEAFRYANLLSVIDTVTPKSLCSTPKSFDVVIHNQSVLSNGFVALAPLRMEIIALPSMSTYAQPWLTQLAIHETRHTSQFSKLNSGIIKPVSFFIGEQSNALATGFVPLWFLEGDAVAFETAASNSGRGRQGDFYQYYRAHYLSRLNRFKYDKWLMGSYKDKIPDHYSLGYQLVSYGKLKYGDQLWSNTLRYVSRYPFTVFPFYFGLKQQTGLSRKQIFLETFNRLDSLWSINQKKNEIIEYQSLVKESREYTDYRYPYPLNDSSMIAYKSSLSKIPRFVIVNLKTGKERTLICPGSLTSIPSYYKNKIFWTEFLPHIRWEYNNYSIIKYYDCLTQKVKTISNRGKYFSPVFSPADSMVYVISAKNDGSSTIEAFNLNGEKTKTIPLPFNMQPFELFYKIEKNYLLVGTVNDKGKSIVKINRDGTLELVYGPTFMDIHSFTADADLIFFSTTNSYKEDVFAFNTETKVLNQQTKSAFGATDPNYNPNTKEIVFSNYSVKGYFISKVKADTLNNIISLKKINDDPITKGLSSMEKFNIDSFAIPDNVYKTEKYRELKTLINIHSWAPFYFDPYQLMNGAFSIKPGITLLSQNLTGSSVLTAGYGFDHNSIVRVNYQYFGLYPVLTYQFNVSNEKPTLYLRRNTTSPSIVGQGKESIFSIYQPLKLSSGKFSTIFYPFVYAIFSNDYLYSTGDSLYHKGFHRVIYRAYFSVIQQMATKNFQPKLGFTADINFENSPLSRNNFGTLLAGSFLFYLPGIGLNHSLLIKTNFQNQNPKRFYYSNLVSTPRGYLVFHGEKFKSISFEYLTPIAYPDFSFTSIAYLKRISLNAFYDYAMNKYPTTKGSQKDVMKSFGFEMFVDVNFFRTRYPIRLKFQQGWTGDNLLPFNSFSMYIDFYGQ